MKPRVDFRGWAEVKGKVSWYLAIAMHTTVHHDAKLVCYYLRRAATPERRYPTTRCCVWTTNPDNSVYRWIHLQSIRCHPITSVIDTVSKTCSHRHRLSRLQEAKGTKDYRLRYGSGCLESVVRSLPPDSGKTIVFRTEASSQK